MVSKAGTSSNDNKALIAAATKLLLNGGKQGGQASNTNATNKAQQERTQAAESQKSTIEQRIKELENKKGLSNNSVFGDLIDQNGFYSGGSIMARLQNNDRTSKLGLEEKALDQQLNILRDQLAALEKQLGQTQQNTNGQNNTNTENNTNTAENTNKKATAGNKLNLAA